MLKTSSLVILLAAATVSYYSRDRHNLLSPEDFVDHDDGIAIPKLRSPIYAKRSPLKLRNNKRFLDNVRNDSSKPSWSWLCQERRCVRTHLPPNVRSAQSWLTCAMLCSHGLWPQPRGREDLSATITRLYPTFSIQIVHSPSKAVTSLIKHAFYYFKRDVLGTLLTDKSDKINDARALVIRVNVTKDPDPKLRLKTSERYSLSIKTSLNKCVVNIRAGSFCGARHAIETLSQLLWFDENIGSVVTFTEAYVEDGPKFPYRGLMLDTARNFFPVEDILRTLDAMAAAKLNTFHWHATDSSSFPIKFRTVPQFAWFGAYSRKEVYTVDDIKKIVQRARVRGIRVVIEIDGPAHVGRAWSWGNRTELGDLASCVEAEPWDGRCVQPPCGQIDPLNKNVYVLLHQMFKEIIQLTGVHDVFHIGTDEVSAECWNEYKYDVEGLLLRYINETKLALIKANNGELPEATIMWSSNVSLRPRRWLSKMVIQVWHALTSDIYWAEQKSKHRMIISNVDAWYLDCGFGSWRDDGAGDCAYNNERKVYENRPWEKHNESAGRFIGGEACLWSELVGRGSLDWKLWPRGAAVGERLWSDPEHGMDIVTLQRLDLHRRRLVRRGVGARALWPRWCSDNPYECQ